MIPDTEVPNSWWLWDTCLWASLWWFKVRLLIWGYWHWVRWSWLWDWSKTSRPGGTRGIFWTQCLRIRNWRLFRFFTFPYRCRSWCFPWCFFPPLSLSCRRSSAIFLEGSTRHNFQIEVSSPPDACTYTLMPGTWVLPFFRFRGRLSASTLHSIPLIFLSADSWRLSFSAGAEKGYPEISSDGLGDYGSWSIWDWRRPWDSVSCSREMRRGGWWAGCGGCRAACFWRIIPLDKLYVAYDHINKLFISNWTS